MTFAIVNPLPFVVSSATAGQGAQNLATPHPREAFVGSASGDLMVVVDLGAVVAIDTLFCGYTTAEAGTVVQAYIGDQSGQMIGQTTIAHSYRLRPLRHAVIAAAAPVQGRYIALVVRTAGSVTIGAIGLGLSIRPKGFEFGGGRPVADTSRVDRLFDGGFGIDRGVAAGGFQWEMPLTDEERDRLYALALDAGIGSTVLVVEPGADEPGGNEAIHWGLLAKLEPYARQAPGENVWSMQVQDWA